LDMRTRNYMCVSELERDGNNWGRKEKKERRGNGLALGRERNPKVDVMDRCDCLQSQQLLKAKDVGHLRGSMVHRRASLS
jgi:hypothetical protein